jgi:hypothetical protein
MTDHIASEIARRAHSGSSSRELRPFTAYALSGAVFLAVVTSRWGTEGGLATSLFAATSCLTLGAFLVVLTRRVLFATIAVSALALLVVLGASIKHKKMNMVMHAYDLVFYLSSWSTVIYLWEDYRRYVVIIAVSLVVAAIICWSAYRIDGSRASRPVAALMMALFATIAHGALEAKGERRHTEFAYSGQYLTYFFSSWPETFETFWRGQLLEAALRSPEPAFRTPLTCNPTTKAPNIILIHQESVVPPSYFPTLKYDSGLKSFFQSHDGRMHKMRVETYGGASWLSEFSLLTGLSTYSFGSMRSFVQLLMADKMHDTLPESLARCGYRNMLFYPMLRNFVSNDRFYSAIGLTEIFDLKDQKARVVNERDRFYYTNAMNEMERHFRGSVQPVFTFIQTMATHWPYTTKFSPELDVPGGGPGTHPEMHEYLRRISIAHMDYDYLKAELARRFPGQEFLIVHYGDHHPMATRMLLGFDERTEAEDVALDVNSVGFLTYFAMEGINYQPPALPKQDVVDIPYLGTLILHSARLPLSDANRERKRLLELCSGRYFSCPDRGSILRFHRRLIDSGLVQAR